MIWARVKKHRDLLCGSAQKTGLSYHINNALITILWNKHSIKGLIPRKERLWLDVNLETERKKMGKLCHNMDMPSRDWHKGIFQMKLLPLRKFTILTNIWMVYVIMNYNKTHTFHSNTLYVLSKLSPMLLNLKPLMKFCITHIFQRFGLAEYWSKMLVAKSSSSSRFWFCFQENH
jgi:hypothetical protein